MPGARFPVLEVRVADWMRNQRVNKITVNVRAIQNYARSVAHDLNINDFVASNTWVERFRKRCDSAKPATIPDLVKSEPQSVCIPATSPSKDTPPEAQSYWDDLDDFSMDNFSSNVQDTLLDDILREFISRSGTFQVINNLSCYTSCSVIRREGSSLVR